MPKLSCPCGFVHDLSPIPDDGMLVIRARDYEAHAESLRAALGGDSEALTRTRELWGRLYVCPDCGRLAWFRNGDERAVIYSPEQSS